ncbi:hypothetical protein [Cutibacterium equinum]
MVAVRFPSESAAGLMVVTVIWAVLFGIATIICSVQTRRLLRG